MNTYTAAGVRPPHHIMVAIPALVAISCSLIYAIFQTEYQHTWLKSTKSGPVGFEKMDFSHFSPCSMQWMFQTPGVSIVHVQKTVSYNNL